MNFKLTASWQNNPVSIPAFPGAYVFTGNFSKDEGAVAVPIYRTQQFFVEYPNYPGQEFVYNKTYYVYVLPGYKIRIFVDVSHQGYSEYDNTNGTEILFKKTTSANNTLCRLFFKGTELTV